MSIWHNLLHRGSSRRMHVVCENAQLQLGGRRLGGTDPHARRTPPEAARAHVRRKSIERFVESAGCRSPALCASGAARTYRRGRHYLLEDYAFLKAVSDDRQSWLDFDVAVYAHEVVDAIYRSAREGARRAELWEAAMAAFRPDYPQRRVIDGTGAAGRSADAAISGDRIAAVGGEGHAPRTRSMRAASPSRPDSSMCMRTTTLPSSATPASTSKSCRA